MIVVAPTKIVDEIENDIVIIPSLVVSLV